MNPTGANIVAWALMSGVLSGISVFCGNFGLFGGPGFLFGVLVLLPFCQSMNTSVTCRVLSVFGSLVGYLAALVLYLATERLDFLGGAVGAVIAVSPLLTDARFRVSFGLIYVVVAGALAGYLGVLMLEYLPATDFWLPLKMTGAMVIWQVSVALALLYVRRRWSNSDH
jgi:hypothetical protein